MPLITTISDTHGLHHQVKFPNSDILIHAGDCTDDIGQASLRSFLEWFEKQPHQYKVLIAGNHDGAFEKWPKEARQMVKDIAPSCIYLEDSGCEILGLKIWGSPVTPEFFDWHFNRKRGADIRKHWELIPEDTDVLITHGPSHGTLDHVLHLNAGETDYAAGCKDLKDIIETKLKNLKLHVFGHLHLDGSQAMKRGEVIYINAASVNERYKVRGAPQLIEITK